MKSIAADPAAAAALWVKAENSKLSAAAIEKMIRLPENEWTLLPKKVTAYADYMGRAGLIPAKPASWQEVFFEEVHKLPGSWPPRAAGASRRGRCRSDLRREQLVRRREPA